MIAIRRANERGHFNHGWLETFHSFSFGEYHDPRFVGFRTLRVINEDFVQPGKGFATHSHANMEILTYVLSGALAHKDSLGNGSEIRPGEIQKMSAGSGISHSEFNASQTEACHLLQIWIHPAQKGLPPSYQQEKVRFAADSPWALLASPQGRDGSVRLSQDALVWAARFPPAQKGDLPLAGKRYGWIQVATGKVRVGNETLGPGDAAALSAVTPAETAVEALTASEFLFFDLA